MCNCYFSDIIIFLSLLNLSVLSDNEEPFERINGASSKKFESKRVSLYLLTDTLVLL